MKIFDLDPPHLMLPPPEREAYSLDGNIRLQNVSYVVGEGVRLLEDINLEIKKNEQIALVGFSGSGKSTLALLIAQLYDSSQGNITIDDHDIEDLCKRDIGSNVAMIAQQPFIFTGTIADNLLYGVQAVTDESATVSREQIHAVVRAVGLVDDVIRFGLQAVLTPDECAPCRDKFLRMRQIIQTSLRDEFAQAIEFYDVDNYLRYSTIRDNIVFGDSMEHEFSVSRLPDHPQFMDLLAREKLAKPLITLGFAIAKQTVDLLVDFQDDEFFFRDNPMEMKEFASYSELLERLKGPQPKDAEERKLLLILALRFIPEKHSIVSLPSALERKILSARHGFLETVVKVDIQQCKATGSGASIVPIFSEVGSFIPFCPSEYLYTRSLRENILFGAVKSEQILVEHLRELASKAFADEQLLDEILAIGLNFEVGSKGDKLSGGQKQKLAIARAFLKDAPILIMDEATASLDNTSQARIQELLETDFRGNKTVIAVIHRLDLTPAYDRIVVLKAGRITEQGTYDELMDKKGDFYGLATAES